MNVMAESIVVYWISPLMPNEEFVAQIYINPALVVGHQSSRVTLEN